MAGHRRRGVQRRAGAAQPHVSSGDVVPAGHGHRWQRDRRTVARIGGATAMWLTIIGMCIVTYALRATMLVTGASRFPAWLERGLEYVPIALFAALVVPGLFRPHGHIALGPEAL